MVTWYATVVQVSDTSAVLSLERRNWNEVSTILPLPVPSPLSVANQIKWKGVPYRPPSTSVSIRVAFRF